MARALLAVSLAAFLATTGCSSNSESGEDTSGTGGAGVHLPTVMIVPALGFAVAALRAGGGPWAAWAVLLACQGQLRLAPGGHVMGIDMHAALTLVGARGLCSLRDSLRAGDGPRRGEPDLVGRGH